MERMDLQLIGKRAIVTGGSAGIGFEVARRLATEGVDTVVCSRDFARAWEDVDFVVTPTSPSTAFELGAKLDDPLAMYLNDFCAVPMSLAGIPAVSIPNGLADGLPTGLQIAGPAFSESRILDAAHALEKAIGFDTTRAFA